MRLVKAKIIHNKRVKNNFYHCVFFAADIAKKASPGQFVNIKVNEGYEPLLRRPFGVHRATGKTVEILFEVVGKSTKILSLKKPGESLDVLGPLGTGFDYRSQVTGHRSQVLVAGGMGVAPLLFLAEKIVARHTSHVTRQKPIVFIGAINKEHLVCIDEFRQLGCNVKIATDDGSKGFKGKITGLLENLLSTIDYKLSTIYACGPKPMLQKISTLSKESNFPAQISLEEHMSCGIGACLGCVVETIDGFKRVCKEGPVFNAQEIIW